MNSQHTHLGARRKLFFSASTAQTPVVAAPRRAVVAAGGGISARPFSGAQFGVRDDARVQHHLLPVRGPRAKPRLAAQLRRLPRASARRVRALRAISADEIARRKAALALHRADVLYDLRDSRAGDHFLAEVAEHCLPNLLPELAAENGWNRTALPAAPRLPTSCGRAAAIARN